MWDVIHGERSLSEAIEATQVEVAQYAKRQRTWLRAEPNLITISAEDEGEALATALDLLWS
jgi:tRNA A37 N6-isopentenylltransferase MiaA